MSVQKWSFDFAHSSVRFVARHMVVARVFGQFNRFSGLLELDPADLTTGRVEVRIDAASIATNNTDRDNHLRSAEFLDVAQHPEIVFTSHRIDPTGGSAFRLIGELSIRGVAQAINLDAKNAGLIEKDPWGQRRILFSASGSLNRSDFGVKWNRALDNGGWLVSERIDFDLDIQATAQT